MAKEMGVVASSRGTKSKNKLSKKRRDALKKKLATIGSVVPKIHESGPLDTTKTTQEKGTCKKFILINVHVDMRYLS